MSKIREIKELIVAIIVCVFISIFINVPAVNILSYKVFENFVDKAFDILMSQLSLTFITVSVLSILSDNKKVIYWSNIVKESLITPMFKNFNAYCIYCFVVLLASFISYGLGQYILTVVYFTVSLIVLIRLAIRMVDIYKNDEEKTKKLIRKYNNLLKSESWEDLKEYYEIHEKLYNETLIANKELNVITVNENLNFCIEYAFSLPESVITIDRMIDLLTNRNIEKIFSFFEKYMSAHEEIIEYQLLVIARNINYMDLIRGINDQEEKFYYRDKIKNYKYRYSGLNLLAIFLAPVRVNKIFLASEDEYHTASHMCSLTRYVLKCQFDWVISSLNHTLKQDFPGNTWRINKEKFEQGVEIIKRNKKSDTVFQYFGVCNYFYEVLIEDIVHVDYDNFFIAMSNALIDYLPIFREAILEADRRINRAKDLYDYLQIGSINPNKEKFLTNILFPECNTLSEIAEWAQTAKGGRCNS